MLTELLKLLLLLLLMGPACLLADHAMKAALALFSYLLHSPLALTGPLVLSPFMSFYRTASPCGGHLREPLPALS